MCFTFFVHAKELPALRLRHLSVNDGLSQNLVSSILQNSRGYMWFGTKDGLNRYDGSHFKVFYHEPSDSASISPGEIGGLLEDSFGNIWIIAGGILNRFDKLSETFTRFIPDPSNPKSIRGGVSAFCESNVGGEIILWLGVYPSGLDKLVLSPQFDPRSAKFEHIFPDTANQKSMYTSTVVSLYVDKRGTLWIASNLGLNSTDLTHGTDRLSFSRYPANSTQAGTLSGAPFTFCESKNGSLWIGASVGLFRLPPDRIGPFQLFKRLHAFEFYFHDLPRSIVEDKHGKLWVAYLGGVATFDPGTSAFTWYDKKSSDGVPFGGITAMYMDRGDNIWFGTPGWGVFQFDGWAKQFRYDSPTEFFQAYPLTLAADLRDTGSSRTIRTSSPFGKPLHDLLSVGASTFPLVDHSGRIWIGTDNGLYRFDSPIASPILFINRPGQSASLHNNYVLAIHEDAHQQIWVLQSDGFLSVYNNTSGDFTHYAVDSLRLRGRIFSMSVSRNNIFWISWGDVGFSRFDPQTGIRIDYKHDPSDPLSLANDHVPSLLLDPLHPDSILWVGTGGAGLHRFDINNKRFTRFTDKDGLPNNFINGILAGDDGMLWVSTNRGLSRFDPSVTGPKAFRNYDISDGLQSNEFNQGACYKTKSGELIFWGIGGLNTFYPEQIIDNPLPPPIVLTDFRISNRSVQFGIKGSPLQIPVGESKEIILSYRDNIIGFGYAALTYGDPRKVRYQYKLENFQDTWVDAGNGQLATFTNLDPGEYVFQVKGSNSDGVWNENGASIRLIITPPPWRTWWAYTLYVIAFGGVVYAARRFEIQRERLKNDLKMKHVEAESLRELDEMKTRFFANISHEFRTPLTLILGPVEQLMEKIKDEKDSERLSLIRRNASKLLQLINQLLDLSRLEARKVKLKASRSNLIPFVRGIAKSFSSLAEKRGIGLQVQSTDETLELYFDKDAMEKVFVNLISNALKFTKEGGMVRVDITRGAENSAEVCVSDTGVGIPVKDVGRIFDRFHRSETASPREFEGTGIGLALVQELVHIHHGTVAVKSIVGEGSSFIVRLPMGKNHLSQDEIVEESIVTEEKVRARLADAGGVEPVEKTSGESVVDSDKTIVLLVEDSADVRAYVKEQIDSSYNVVEAVDGMDGLEKALAIVPDLVVSDLMMPKMDGYELCKKLKTDEKTSHIPVILLTAKAGDEDKLQGLETGADDYLIKPFNSKELVVRIRNLIELRRKLRQRFSESLVVKPRDIAVNSVDQIFLEKILAIIETHMGDEEFTVERLSEEMGMSHMQLHRKLKALTSQSASLFIRHQRLQRGMELLRNNAGNVSEIAYRVGFSSPAYFTKCFREQFGSLPSDLFPSKS